MPTDHPDGTRPIVISRADIQMPIDVQHQTVNVKTNFKEQEVGVYQQFEWAAKVGDSKQLAGTRDIDGPGLEVIIDYTTPADKKFYITHIAVSSHAFSESLVGLDIGGRLYNFTDSNAEAYISGNFGAWGAFTTPLVIEASHRIQLTVYNVHSTAMAAFEATLGGYLA